MKRHLKFTIVLLALAVGVWAQVTQVEHSTASHTAASHTKAQDGSGGLFSIIPVVSAEEANVPIAPDETEAAAAGNLKLWLKVDAITGLNDGDSAPTWPDSSGNGFDGSSASNNPTF